MIQRSEATVVADAMERYGGSFANALAHLIRQSDLDNLQKIQATWPEEWEKYLYFANHQMWDDIQREREERRAGQTD